MTVLFPMDAPCWNCGEPNDSLTNLNGHTAPKDGDGTICRWCCAIGTIENGSIRKATNEEVIEALQIPEVRYALKIISWNTYRMN